MVQRSHAKSTKYTNSVFINCPFDDQYKPLFRAIIFTLMYCKFTPRCAAEDEDSDVVRIEKIYELITQCRLGIHDLSRTSQDRKTKFPRFNMPFELGVFLGAKKFGPILHTQKACLVLIAEDHTHKKFITDISGQDPKAHNNDAKVVIHMVRNWLSKHRIDKTKRLAGEKKIQQSYEKFAKGLPRLCRKEGFGLKTLTFSDYLLFVIEWLKQAKI